MTIFLYNFKPVASTVKQLLVPKLHDRAHREKCLANRPFKPSYIQIVL